MRVLIYDFFFILILMESIISNLLLKQDE